MDSSHWGLAGRVAVVTGASGGIGRAASEALVAAGAIVVGLDLKKPAGDDFLGIELDLKDSKAIEAVASRILDEMGSVDIVVNAAGTAREGDVLNADAASWDEVLDVNARGLFLISQAFARGMAGRGYGKIINFASRCAFVGYEKFVSYNASKAAVVAVTNTMAVELGGSGVCVNAIAPGFIHTPMVEYAMEDEELYGRLTSRIPRGRFGTPEEVAGLVLFLASPHSDYISGTTIPIDGGMLVA